MNLETTVEYIVNQCKLLSDLLGWKHSRNWIKIRFVKFTTRLSVIAVVRRLLEMRRTLVVRRLKTPRLIPSSPWQDVVGASKSRRRRGNVFQYHQCHSIWKKENHRFSIASISFDVLSWIIPSTCMLFTRHSLPVGKIRRVHAQQYRRYLYM